jgi:uncharacterized repeat protein (TIGR01451 family)
MKVSIHARRGCEMRGFKAIAVIAMVFLAAFIPARASAAPGSKGADLSIVITDDPDPVVYRWNVTYTATVRNHGPDEAEAVKAIFGLHSDMGFVSGSVSQGTWRYDGGSMTASLGTIPSGKSAIVTVVGTDYRFVRVPLSGTVSSTARDPVQKNNQWTEWTAVIEGPAPPSPTPSGGVFTGGGGTATGPSAAGLATILLLAAAGLAAVRVRWANR